MTFEIKEPTQCHLWQADKLESADLDNQFETVETFSDESHHLRNLLKCKKCGQLYFHEFYEEIDWEDGEDPQYSTYVPVSSQAEIEALKKTDIFSLLNFSPRLQKDFPKGSDKPRVFWLGK